MKAGSSLRSLTLSSLSCLRSVSCRAQSRPDWVQRECCCYASTPSVAMTIQPCSTNQLSATDSSSKAGPKAPGPRLDLQQHLADLEAAGLLVRIDRPINKDTELIPLVRWQFIGGMPEDQRRAFLFTNVIDSKGRKYDMPVVVGALAVVAGDLRARHGPPGRGDRRGLDGGDRQSDPAGRDQRRAVPGGRHHRRRAEDRKG